MKKFLSIIVVLALLLPCFSINAAAFSDVASGIWYADSVEYVTQKELFNGTGNDTFSPDSTMTRGMFVTVLGRMAKVSTSLTGSGTITKEFVNLRAEANTTSAKLDMLDKGETVEVTGVSADWYMVRHDGITGYIRNDLMTASVAGLTDVEYSAYYAPYIAWAYKNKIATASSAGKFSPDTPITREDVCVFLKNYCDYYNLSFPVVAEKSLFVDEGSITNTGAVYTLQQSGIINGRDTGAFDPSASITRCEVAALFHRYCTTEMTTVAAPTTPIDTYSGYELFANMPQASAPVDSSYFDDACFIGHSLVVGMSMYFGLPNADFYAVSGTSASRMLTYSQFELDETEVNEEGETVNKLGTISDVLLENDYGKIYIMLGINELGGEPAHATSYYNNMSKLVDMVKSAKPNADIYLISITPITESLSAESERLTRDNIIKFNEKLQTVAVEKDVYYLDAFGEFCDSYGHMPTNLVLGDGYHLLVNAYATLKTMILTHTA